MKRRLFVKKIALTGFGMGIVGTYSCSNTGSTKDLGNPENGSKLIENPFFKLSLAQWSIHRMIREQGMDPYAFASKAKEWGFEGLEYVSQLYMTKKESMGGEGFNSRIDSIVSQLKAEASSNDIKSLVMMMDLEEEKGDLAWSDESKRTQAVEAHYPWVEATSNIGCHSIRVNLFGEKDPIIWKAAAVKALSKLGDYANQKNVNVIVENHGWLSSNAGLLMEVINEVGMQNVGTLPDFGNFCIKRPDNSRWNGCLEEYDRYKGVAEMMPKAFAISAKSKDFDKNGEETSTNYTRMLEIIKDSGFSGFIGVEYEGKKLSEEEGIMATKKLLLKEASKIV